MMRSLIAVVVVVMAFTVGVAYAMDMPEDPLAFTPTGDALWDTYAQANLDLLAAPDAFIDGNGPIYPHLSEEVLDSWEALFGDDPRYWQLRYWEAERWMIWDEQPTAEPIAMLMRGEERGAVDAVSRMQLYKLRKEELTRNWDMYAEGTLPEGSDFAPVITDGAAPYSWYVDERLKLIEELVAACPDESWAWYESAIVRFEFGEWETGLSEMEAGNQAANNRMPLPFPMSFVAERVRAGGDCGSTVAAGQVLQGNFMIGMPNFMRIKDQAKNQEVRMLLGAPLSEFAPWHAYTCRLGVMEGADSIQWLVAHVIRNMILRDLFVETPEAFTVDQRQALWGLYGRGFKVRELSKTANETTAEENKAAIELHAMEYNLAEKISEELGEDGKLSPQLQEQLYTAAATNYHYRFLVYQREQTEYYPKVKERFEQLASFDMVNYCWPGQ